MLPERKTMANGKHPGGRPSKLTPELKGELLTLLAAGKPMKACCAKVGIDEETFRLWRLRARNGEPAMVEFFGLVAHARAEGELHLWDIAKEGEGQDARNAQWILERTRGDTYAPRLNVKLQEGLEELLGHVERVCGAKDCGCFGQILAALNPGGDSSDEAAAASSEPSPIH